MEINLLSAEGKTFSGDYLIKVGLALPNNSVLTISCDERYEFSNYKKNLERGVGLCSIQSTIVKGVLLDNGMKAELLDVDGHHVVVRADYIA